MQSLNMGGARTARGLAIEREGGKARRRGRRFADNAITKRALLPPPPLRLARKISRGPFHLPTNRAAGQTLTAPPTPIRTTFVTSLSPPSLCVSPHSLTHSPTLFHARSRSLFLPAAVLLRQRRRRRRHGRVLQRRREDREPRVANLRFVAPIIFFGLPSPPLPSSFPPSYAFAKSHYAAAEGRSGGAAGNT